MSLDQSFRRLFLILLTAVFFCGFVLLVLSVKCPSGYSKSCDDEEPPPPADVNAGLLDELSKSCRIIDDVVDLLLVGRNGLCKSCCLIADIFDNRCCCISTINCYAAVTVTEGLKALFGYHLVHQWKWVRNIVEG